MKKIIVANLGFTLIELLMVIAIIGILVSIAAPRLVHIRDKAQDSKIAAIADNIKTGLELYYQDHDQYPQQTTVNHNWNQLNALLTNVQLGGMGEHNIKTFNYTIDAENNYKIEVDSNSTNKTYIITSNSYQEKN